MFAESLVEGRIFQEACFYFLNNISFYSYLIFEIWRHEKYLAQTKFDQVKFKACLDIKITSKAMSLISWSWLIYFLEMLYQPANLIVSVSQLSFAMPHLIPKLFWILFRKVDIVKFIQACLLVNRKFLALVQRRPKICCQL